MNKPRISIITITFNSAKTIEETIKSVISQGYDNLEYLIIDGGSKDHTLDIVNKYRDKIAYIVSEPDKGISDAFNKGIDRATGEIIGIINSDDILEPGAIRTIAEAYNPNIDVYSGNVLIWDDETNKSTVHKPDLKFDRLKLQYNVAHPARFIRKSAYNKWGRYAIDLRYKMDIDLLVRFAKAGANFAHINKPLARFRKGGATSQSIWKKRNDFYLFVTRNGWSQWNFRFIWSLAVVKYYIKKILRIS